MAKVLRKRLPNWALLLSAIILAVLVMAYLALNKPLPEYFVAASALSPGQALKLEDLKSVRLDLADQASSYLSVNDFKPGLQVIDVVATGELILLRELTSEQLLGQTAMVISPSSENSDAIKSGAWAQIWRTRELAEEIVTELLVPRAKILSVIEPEGFINDGRAAVQVMVSVSQSNLIMESITAELDIFLLPTP